MEFTLNNFPLVTTLHTISHDYYIFFEASSDISLSILFQGSKKKANSDLKYDIFGWIILAVGIVAWMGIAKSHVPPPPI